MPTARTKRRAGGCTHLIATSPHLSKKGNTVSNTVLKTFADLKAAKGPKFEQPKPISSLEPKQPTQTKPQPPVDLLRKVR